MPHMLGPTEVIGGGGADPGLFSATCAAGSLSAGQLVYLTGNAGPEVALCDPTDITKMPCCGAVVDVPTPATCNVRSLGSASAWTGLDVGKPYWVGLTGYPANAPPAGPAGSVRYAQPIGKALDATTIQLNVAETLHRFPR